MSKRVTLQLTDEALAVLHDREIVPYMEQGLWVSRAILAEGERVRAAQIAETERRLARLRAGIRPGRP